MSIPSVVYLAMQGRRSQLGPQVAAHRIGLTWGRGSSYILALALLVPLGILAYIAIDLIPSDVLDTPAIVIARVATVASALGVLLRALGEEVLFRGLLAGILFRRLGFRRGNLLQAFIFLVPHLVLLTVDVRVWPVLPIQFIAGGLLGWLRHKADSFAPGAFVHAITNLAAGVIAAG